MQSYQLLESNKSQNSEKLKQGDEKKKHKKPEFRILQNGEFIREQVLR